MATCTPVSYTHLFFCNLVIGQPAHETAQDLHLTFGELGAHGGADLHAGRRIWEDVLPRHRAAHDLHQGPFIAVLIPPVSYTHLDVYKRQGQR